MLGHGHGWWRFLCQSLGQSLGGGLQFVRGDPVGDQTAALRFLCCQGIAGQQQAVGILATDQGRKQQAGAGFRDQAQIDKGSLKTGIVGGHHQVRMEQQGGADTGGIALHANHHRFVQGHQGVNQHHGRAELAAIPAGRVRIEKIADIVAGTPGPTIAGEQ